MVSSSVSQAHNNQHLMFRCNDRFEDVRFGKIIYLFITPNGSTYKIYKSIYKKHTIHSIKENYKLGLQFIHCYEKIAVSTKCRHKLRFSSATPEHRLRMEYFDNILPYSCVHIAEKDRITLLSHVRIFFINSNFR